MVAANISLLAPHLGGKAYPIRSAIVTAVGHLIHKAFAPSTAGADAQGTLTCSPFVFTVAACIAATSILLSGAHVHVHVTAIHLGIKCTACAIVHAQTVTTGMQLALQPGRNSAALLLQELFKIHAPCLHIACA